jgi:LysR family transcriptional regulator, transcriptional activator for dmlA
MSAAGRDQRLSAAVVSSRISELEKHFAVRLFNRTTRSMTPTSHGKLLYTGATKILDTIAEVEGGMSEITDKPKGSIFVAAPLGLGKKLIAPVIPLFNERYPDIHIRLRLTDRSVDITNEGLDAAFILGRLSDSELRVRHIHDFDRVLCAAPAYVEKHGMPETGEDLISQGHKCLLLRYPGADEFFWMLQVDGNPKRYDFQSPLESDDGDVLTAWALAGCGVINKAIYEVADALAAGELVIVAQQSPPTPLPFACVYPHKRLQDHKVRLFIDYALSACKGILEVED